MTVRVVVLDDSFICRDQLRSFLEVEGDIEVVAEGSNGEDALRLVKEHRPDLLVVDLQMPRADGHTAITQVMAHQPLPILVVTGNPVGPDRAIVFESIRRGALDLAEKPSIRDEEAQLHLRQTVRRLATLPVVRHVAGKLHATRKGPPSLAPSPSLRSTGQALANPVRSVVGIGASAGGPAPLAELLGALPADTKAAIFVVQHLPPAFSGAFCDFLSSRTALPVQLVDSRQPIERGTIYIVAGDRHLALVERNHAAPLDAPERNGHRPSVDVLLESLAHQFGGAAAGILLSGMGQDGVLGLGKIKSRGGLCLAQNRETAPVWGMPKVATETGVASKALPPTALAAEVFRFAEEGSR